MCTIMEPDAALTDNDYAESTSSTYATSIATSIRKGKTAYGGRTYAAYGKHDYGLPSDEAEQDRNELQHYKFILLQDGPNFSAPIPADKLTSVLDLGTGTGMWAIEMADQIPNARVIGVDIAAVQPSWVPPNCEFHLFDIENPTDWEHLSTLEGVEEGLFDYIHARELYLSIRDWPTVLKACLAHLKPGGWLELGTTVPVIKADDDSLPSDRKLHHYMSDLFFEIASTMGADGHAPGKWKQQMADAGFEDVTEIPYKVPRNPWPKEKRLKDAGALELINFLEFAPPLFRRGWVEVLGRKAEDVEEELAKGLEYAKDRNVHSYVTL